MLTITNQLILEQIPGCVAWKDMNLKYGGANNNLLIAMNLQHQDEVIGLEDDDLGINSSRMNAFHRQQDLLALQGHSLEVIHHLESLDNVQDNRTFFLLKTPLRDEQGEIIGVIYNCMPWVQANLLDSLKQIDKKFQAAIDALDYYSFDTHHNPAKLSERELECLFLQLRGHSAKQIAEILGLSKRTIEFYIDNIKSKLGCLTKTELLVTAVEKNYQRHVPKSLLKLNLPELLKN